MYRLPWCNSYQLSHENRKKINNPMIEALFTTTGYVSDQDFKFEVISKPRATLLHDAIFNMVEYDNIDAVQTAISILKYKHTGFEGTKEMVTQPKNNSNVMFTIRMLELYKEFIGCIGKPRPSANPNEFDADTMDTQAYAFFFPRKSFCGWGKFYKDPRIDVHTGALIASLIRIVFQTRSRRHCDEVIAILRNPVQTNFSATTFSPPSDFAEEAVDHLNDFIQHKSPMRMKGKSIKPKGYKPSKPKFTRTVSYDVQSRIPQMQTFGTKVTGYQNADAANKFAQELAFPEGLPSGVVTRVVQITTLRHTLHVYGEASK